MPLVLNNFPFTDTIFLSTSCKSSSFQCIIIPKLKTTQIIKRESLLSHPSHSWDSGKYLEPVKKKKKKSFVFHSSSFLQLAANLRFVSCHCLYLFCSGSYIHCGNCYSDLTSLIPTHPTPATHFRLPLSCVTSLPQP